MSSRGGAPQLAYGQLGGNSRVHVANDGVHVSDAEGNDRVHLGRLGDGALDEFGLPVGSYGLRATNPAGTVIIDGTSDMFRIVASGTLSIIGDGLANSYQTSALNVATGLTYRPAFTAFFDSGAALALALPYVWFNTGTGAFEELVSVSMSVINTNQTRVELAWHHRPLKSYGISARFFIFEQASI